MVNKYAYTIEDQIQLLNSRGILFRDETQASFYLKNISYYRLKGYWWDMQSDFANHLFKPDSYFEEVINRENMGFPLFPKF
jgi:abortive infection bacteriophage resistance protein